MILTIASFKGGVGKTTTAVHLATYLQQSGPTALVDGDSNRSASNWARRGALPFRVIPEHQVARHAKEFEHFVIDTEPNPKPEEFKEAAEGCDLLVLPTTPDALSLDAMMLTVQALQKVQPVRFRVLLTILPPRPSRDGEEARRTLEGEGLPVFRTGIRRLVAFQKAALHGVPVRDVDDPRAAEGWADYLAVGGEIER